MTVVERKHLICKNKLLMKESKYLKRQLETEEDLQEKCNLQYKCMEELSDNLSQIIVGKTIIEDALKRLKMAYLKNEKEFAYLQEKLEQCSKYKTKDIQLNKKLRYRDHQVAKNKEKINILTSEKELLISEKNKLEK